MARVLICGSRYCSWDRAVEVKRLIARLPKDTVIIHGAAPGVDTAVDRAARELGFEVIRFPAHWRHTTTCQPNCDRVTGKRAGPLRNQQMIDEGTPDQVIAFPSRNSVGTWDMVRRAEKAGLPVEVREPLL